jgi:hypothetical protein
MAMKDNKFDIDAILQKSLASSEKPAPELLSRIKYKLSEEEYRMKRKNFKIPSVAAVALIAVFSLSVVAFAAQPVWQYVQTRIIEGQQYVEDFTVMKSDDEDIMSLTSTGNGDMGRVVVEIDGEQKVLSDPLAFDSLDEALALLQVEAPMTPSYLPEGYYFKNAVFPISPVSNLDLEHAGKTLLVNYSNGVEDFFLSIARNEASWGLGFWSTNLEDITVNGHNGRVGAGGLALQVGEHTLVRIMSQGENNVMENDELVKIAESLQ